MKQNIFAQGLMHASSTELRTIYALLAETKLTSLLTVKAKELFKKEIDHFNELLQKEIQKLDHYSDEELRLKLFLYFTKVLDLKSGDYTNSSVIEAKGEEIIFTIHELMLKDKDYEQFVIHAPGATIAELIVQYQMQNVFRAFDKQFQQLNTEQVTGFTSKIADFILTLSTEQQHLFKQQFQLEEITAHTIYQALLTYGTVAVLSFIVEIAGFHAYQSLVAAIATSSALAGVTLPIGLYTGATSLLLIVTNPLFLVTLAVGGGGLLFYRQNKKLRQNLLPIGILQLLLPVMLNAHTQKDYLSLSKEWQKKLQLQTIYVEKLQTARSAFELQKATVASHNTKIANNDEKIKALYQEIHTIKQQLNEQTTTIQEAEKSEPFQEVTAQIAALALEIQQLQTELTNPKEKTGFLRSISGFFDNNARKSKLAQLEKQQQQLLDRRAELIIEMAPNAFTNQIASLKQAVEKIEVYEQDSTIQQQDKAIAAKQIEELKNTIFELDTVIKKQQKEYPGLGDMKLID